MLLFLNKYYCWPAPPLTAAAKVSKTHMFLIHSLKNIILYLFYRLPHFVGFFRWALERCFCVRARNLWLLRFYTKCHESLNMSFLCECCAFLHSRAQVFNAARAPDATKSMFFAASICWFAEFTSWVLFVFSIDGHRCIKTSAFAWCVLQLRHLTKWIWKFFLELRFVAQFGTTLRLASMLPMSNLSACSMRVLTAWPYLCA